MIGFFPIQILILRMLCNNADACRCSYFELGLPVVTRFSKRTTWAKFALCMIHFGQFFNILSTSTANELKKWWWERKIFQMIILWGFFLGFVMAVWIILLIMPTMHPCSLWKLRNFLCMTKPQLFKFYHRNPYFFPHKPLNFCYCKISLQRSGITLQRSADS